MQASAAEQTLIMSMFVQAVIHTVLKGTHASGYHFWHKYRFLYLYHLPSVQWILHGKSVINAPLSPIRFACRVTSVPITGAWECKWGWSPGSHTCASWARRLPLCRPCFQVCKEVWGKKIVHFQIHATHYRPAVINPAGQVWERSECKNKGVLSTNRLLRHGCCERGASISWLSWIGALQSKSSRQLQLISVWLRDSDLLPSATCRTDRIPWQRLRASPDRWSLSVHLASHISLSIRLAPPPDIKHLSCLCPFQTC